MKKTGVLLLALFLALCIPFTALADVSSIEYKDEKTGTEFIVPAGWTLTDKAEIGVEADYTFVHDESVTALEEAKEQAKEKKSKKKEAEADELVVPYITYRSDDIYSSMPEDKKQSRGREDFDLDAFTAGELAEYLGIKETKLAPATYNRVDYYRFTSKAKKFTPSLKKGQRVTGYITALNGYVYTVMFFDATTSEVYDDFKMLMGSIIIEGKTPKKPKKEKLFTPVKIISVIIMLAAIGAFAFVLIKAKKK